jgi:S-adenosylmethionine decarboxylase
MPPVASKNDVRMREGHSHRWRLLTADLSGIAPERLNDPAALEAVLTRCLLQVLGHAPTRWVCHRFDPQGVSLVGSAARVRVAVHTWPELRAATMDVWSDRAALTEAVERCATLLGGRSAPRRAPSCAMQLPGE